MRMVINQLMHNLASVNPGLWECYYVCTETAGF